MIDHPPMLDAYNITHAVALRFTSSSSQLNKVITYQNLHDTILIATTATQGFQLFDQCRIRKISVWGQAVVGTISTVAVDFVTSTGDRDYKTDTSLGIKPAYVRTKPSAKSLASFWQLSTAGNAFELSCPAQSIIDVHLSFRTSNAPPTAAQNVLVGATPGDIYYRGLDGAAFATTTLFPPTGVLSI
jgi:hypothetical protein